MIPIWADSNINNTPANISGFDLINTIESTLSRIVKTHFVI